MTELLAALQPLDWVVAGAAAIALYVLVDMWVKSGPPLPAADAGE